MILNCFSAVFVMRGGVLVIFRLRTLALHGGQFLCRINDMQAQSGFIHSVKPNH